MQYKDYYAVLGVKREASQDEIKQAYRRLARKYHPDVSTEKDAEARFKEVGEAYEVLKDPEKRSAYDNLGANWHSGDDFTTPPNWGSNFEFTGGYEEVDAAAFSDFFENLFGQHSKRWTESTRQRQSRGQDHHAKILINLEDTYQGVERMFTLQKPVVTGDGHVRTDTHTLKVRIPKGIRAGQKIRLSGQGALGMGQAPAGDLYLEVDFNPHRLFRVEGKDVSLSLPVAPWEAAMGAKVKLPVPDGQLDMKIPPGSTSGRRLRIKGRGIPGTPPGDLYVQLEIVVPPADNAAAKELYEEMAQKMKFNPRASLFS